MGRLRVFDTDKALDAALKLFWRHGYEGTSVAALTKAMRISPPSLYAAFGDKAALFKKAVDRYIERPASYLHKAISEPTARGVAESALSGAIEMVMQPRHGDSCLLVSGALACHPDAQPVRKQLSERRAAAETAIRRRFTRAIREHDLPATADPAQLANFLMTIIWGLSVQAAGGASRKQLQQVARIALQYWPA